MQIPRNLEDFISALKVENIRILGANLYGIYIYGSISYGDFIENTSDIDIIALTKVKLSREEISRLKEMFISKTFKETHWVAKLEMEYIAIEQVNTFEKNVTTIHFSDNKIVESYSLEGPCIEWQNLRECGITVYGPSPLEFVPTITRKEIDEALKEKFRHLKTNSTAWMKINLWNQLYIIVQLCRVAYRLTEGAPISKKNALTWGVNVLPDEFKSLISTVIDNHERAEGPPDENLTVGIQSFIKYIESLFSEQSY